MKKIISILSIILAFALNISAQECFYYSGGEKIPLTKVQGKRVTIATKSNELRENIKVEASCDIIEDERLIIVVNHREVDSAESIVLDAVIAKDNCYLDNNGRELYPTGYFNIKLKDSEDYPLLVQIAKQNGLEIVKPVKYMALWYVLRISSSIDGGIIDVANRIYETGIFASCSPAFSFDAEEISYDPQVNLQWNLFNANYPLCDISVSEAWSFASGKGIKIAFIDSGVDVNHQDLNDNILISYDFHADTSVVSYYSNHGTFCAGVAAARRNNGLNITGIAPDAKILVAATNTKGQNMTQEAAAAISWAWQNGADIISCSLECDNIDILRDAIDSAMTYGRNGKGSIIVKSAGNNGYITFPGTYRDDIIVVGAIDSTGNLYTGSGIGENLFLCAPGVDVLSTSPNSQMMYGSGTSAACPHVSGVIALMLERNPNLTIDQVREILAETAVKIGNLDYNLEGEFGVRNNSFGYGLVNAYQAVINTPRN